MYPLINIGPMQLPTYGLIGISGFVIGVLVAVFVLAKVYGYPKDYTLYASIFAGIGLLAGAKLLYFITALPNFIKIYPELVEARADGIVVVSYLFGGFVFYGGFIGAALMLLLFCKLFSLPFLPMVNIMAPVVPLIHGIGRIGCFFGGCCYGIEYHGFGAVHFHYNELVPELSEVPRFPVQLVEAGLNFILFAFLMAYSRKARKGGSVMGIYLICYTVIRFALEFFRGDSVRGSILGVTTSQWISLLLIPIGIFLIIRKEKKNIEATTVSEDFISEKVSSEE